MKRVTTVKFVAFDGVEFDNEENVLNMRKVYMDITSLKWML